VEILAAAETLRVPAAVDLAAIVIGALTGGVLAARDAEVRAEAEGDSTADESATDLEVAPAQ